MLAGLDDLTSGGGHRVKPEKKDIWKVVVGLIAFLLLVVLYAYELKWFSLTFDSGTLIWRSVLLGAILGGGLGYWMTKDMHDLFERTKIVVMILAIGAIALPLFASLSNRLLAGKVESEKVEFVKLEPFLTAKFELKEEGYQPDGYNFFFVRNQAIQHVKITEALYKDTPRGDLIEIPVRKGLWRFDVLDLK